MNYPDHFDGKTYFNPWKASAVKKGPFPLLRWLLARRAFSPWPDWVDNLFQDKPPKRVEQGTLRICYIGHATLLIQLDGVNILTDPVWAERASPFSFYGPKRVCSPGISYIDLPPIDAVFVSHNHYDHLDYCILQKLWRRDRSRIITPLGNRELIHRFDAGIEVEEGDWGDVFLIKNGIKLHIEPAYHWSRRGLFDRNRSLWGSCVIESTHGNVYFSGDTGYGGGEHFRLIRDKFIQFRCALLPIGAYEPRALMKQSHTNPKEAVQAMLDLNAQSAIAIHHRVFQLTAEGYDQPTRDLEKALMEKNIELSSFRAPAVGEHIEYR